MNHSYPFIAFSYLTATDRIEIYSIEPTRHHLTANNRWIATFPTYAAAYTYFEKEFRL